MREREVVRVVGRVGVERRLNPVRQVVRGERGERDLADRLALVGVAAHRPAAVGPLQVVGRHLEHGRRDHAGLLPHLVAGVDDRRAADDERPRPVGVHALVRDRRVAVQHPDVLERDAELVGDDLRPRGLVALAVRARPGDHLDLAGGQHPDRRVLPAARRVGERAEHPGRREPAHLGERRDADAQAHGRSQPRSVRPAPCAARRSGTAPWRVRGGRLVVARVVGQPGDRGVRELLVLDPVHVPAARAGPCRARRPGRPSGARWRRSPRAGRRRGRRRWGSCVVNTPVQLNR